MDCAVLCDLCCKMSHGICYWLCFHNKISHGRKLETIYSDLFQKNKATIFVFNSHFAPVQHGIGYFFLRR